MMRWPRIGGSLRPEKSGPDSCSFPQWAQWAMYPLGGSLKIRHRGLGGRGAVAPFECSPGFDPQHLTNQCRLMQALGSWEGAGCEVQGQSQQHCKWRLPGMRGLFQKKK